VAPAGTPKPIVDRLAAEIATLVKDPKFIERLHQLGLEPITSSPAEFALVIAKDIPLWADAVKTAGLADQLRDH